MVSREILSDKSVLLKAEQCSITHTQLRPGAVLVKIVGYDTGAIGNATFDELGAAVGRFGRFHLFVDLSETMGAKTEVREAWTHWFQANRQNVHQIAILVQSKFVHTAVEIAKFFSRTGELITIYSDPKLFEDAIAKVVPGFAEKKR